MIRNKQMEKIVPYKSPNYLSKWLIIFLVAEIIITFVSAKTSAVTGIEENHSWKFVIESADTIISLSVIGLFVYWFFRTYHNLQSLGVKGLRYSAKRVIISFFIIGLNLFEPIKGLKDLWKGSDPLVDISDGYSWKKAAVPTGLGIWWIFAVATRFHEVTFFGTGSESLQTFWDTAIVPFLLLIINTATIVIVRRICSRQERKKKLILG